LLFDGEIQVNQKGRLGGIIDVLVDQEVIDRDVSVQDTGLA